jgi:hypothetical protein
VVGLILMASNLGHHPGWAFYLGATLLAIFGVTAFILGARNMKRIRELRNRPG